MTPTEHYELLTDLLRADVDLDVDVRGGALYVADREFARLDGDVLAVLLPESRAADLIARNVGRPIARGTGSGAWLLVDDPADWLELASEAHMAAHGPLPGRQS